MNDILLSLSAF